MDVTQVVELRVHGVSGTPPEELLLRPVVRQVAGDRTAGFYRPRPVEERADAPVDDPTAKGAPLEGYAWGGLTSGSPSRALWLLLLPFTLVNVAPRLRPARPGDVHTRPALVWTLWYLNRLLAAALTVSLTLALCGVGLDLLGWQCGGPTTSCAKASPGWLLRPVIALAPGRQLAVGALIPLLALLILSQISGRTISRYESVLPDLPMDAAADSPVEVGLESPWMWRGEHLTRRLRHLHLQVGLATVLAMGSWPLDSGWRWGALVVAIAAGVFVAALLACPAVTRHAHSRRMIAVFWTTWAALAAASAVTAVLLIRNTRLRVPAGYLASADNRGLPGYADALLIVFAVDLALLVALSVVVVLLRGRSARPSPRPGLLGLGTIALATLGVLLGAVFGSGLYLYLATFFTTGSLKPSFVQIAHVSDTWAVPEAIRVAALAYLISAVFVVAVSLGLIGWIAVSLARIRPGGRTFSAEAFAADYPQRDPSGPRGKQILRAGWLARLVDLGGAFVGVLLFPGAVLTLVATAVLVLRALGGPRHPADMLSGRYTGAHSWFPADGWNSATSLQGAGAYLVVLSVFGLILLGAAAFRVPATRRSVGILWDLASFWPRGTHPLAAPCYAERTVPDLITRIRWYLDGEPGSDYPAGAVVLAGHSQGTVISAAVLRQIAAADAAGRLATPLTPRIAFLSYGCVLRRLYARYFPAYFGTSALDAVAATLQSPGGPLRWRNLWRRTDYLGGPVGCGPSLGDAPDVGPLAGADRELIDPVYDAPPGDTVPPSPGRHSNYPVDPAFQAEVATLAATL